MTRRNLFKHLGGWMLAPLAILAARLQTKPKAVINVSCCTGKSAAPVKPLGSWELDELHPDMVAYLNGKHA